VGRLGGEEEVVGPLRNRQSSLHDLLELPPVDSAETAVRVAIAASANQ